jgi:hypothetical protein
MVTASRPRSLWPSLVLTAVLVLSIWVAAGAQAADRNAENSEHFWTSLQYDFIEAEHYSSLGAMARAADAVVIGRLTSIVPGRVWGDPPDAAYYAEARLEVTRLIAGSLVPVDGALQFELFMAEPEVFDGLKATLPTEEGIYFLRNKGAEAAVLGKSVATENHEAVYYRLVNMAGLLRMGPGGETRVMPGRHEAFLADLAERPFDAVLADVDASLTTDP